MARTRGSVNKASGAVKELAQKYGADTIQALGDMAGLNAPGLRAESEQVRLGAMRELLDRGYGKATQPISGEGGGAIHLFVDTGVVRAEDDASHLEEG